jgi:steroid delta-isomerase-like uncharacterized protein
MYKEPESDIGRKVEQFWNNGNPALINQLFAPNYQHHDPHNPEVYDLETYTRWLTALRAAFPDLRMHIDDIITEGNKVVLRWTIRGTHTGEYMGLLPTGQKMTLSGINVYYVADGKITEAWFNYDSVGMMGQLGGLSVQAQAWEQTIEYLM